MRLLFDLNSLRLPRSGIGYYTQHLLEGLLKEPSVEKIAGWVGTEIFEGERLGELLRQQVTRTQVIEVSNGLTAKLWEKSRTFPGVSRVRGFVRHSMSQTLRAEYAARGYIYHETNYIASKYNGPTVVTIHDLSHRRHPEFHPRVAVEYLNRHLPRTLAQAQRIIADSFFTKKDIVEIYGVPAEKVVPIHLGVDASFRPYPEDTCVSVLKELGLANRGFVLSVCTLQPRKNLHRLVEAFAGLPSELRQAYPLVLIGSDGWKNSELRALIEPLYKAGQIRMPGYIPRASLLKLYSSAALFAYPSLFEGFGLPVAEAMASGVPVLTSNTTSIPEVSAGAAWEVDPFSIEEITSGIHRLLSDAPLRDALVRKGLRRAADLTWDATVARTLDVYRSLSK